MFLRWLKWYKFGQQNKHILEDWGGFLPLHEAGVVTTIPTKLGETVNQGEVNHLISFTQDVYAAIHKGGLWLGPRFQARKLRLHLVEFWINFMIFSPNFPPENPFRFASKCNACAPHLPEKVLQGCHLGWWLTTKHVCHFWSIDPWAI